MIRIWAHTIVNSKNTRSYIYESIDEFVEEKFRFHIERICHELDIPTPVILQTHLDNFANFNLITFSSKDFIESVDFEKLVIENAILSK